MENNWKEKTIESLEKDIWGSPDGESHLIKTCHALRKKQLKKFEIEDCRIMIGQDIGTKFILPIALDFLDENILAEGDFYKGDLLKSIIEINESFWASNKDCTERFNQIIERQKSYLENEDKGLFRNTIKWKENVV